MYLLRPAGDANGPRVTNSTGFKAAADWVVKRLEGYGLINVKQEPWGAFGRSISRLLGRRY